MRTKADPLMHILLDGRPLDWYGLSATDGVLAIGPRPGRRKRAPGMAGSRRDPRRPARLRVPQAAQDRAQGVVTVGGGRQMMDARRRLGSLIGRLATLSYQGPRSVAEPRHDQDWDERMLDHAAWTCLIVMDTAAHIMEPRQRIHAQEERANLTLHVTGNRPPAWPV